MLMRFGTLFTMLRQLAENVAAEVFEPRAAEREHRAAFVIDDLDAHAFRRHVEQDLVLELRQRLALIDGLAQLSSRAFEPLVVELLFLLRRRRPACVAVCVPGSRRRGRRRRRRIAVQLHAAAELDHAGARAARALDRRGRGHGARALHVRGIVEVFGDRALLLFGGRAPSATSAGRTPSSRSRSRRTRLSTSRRDGAWPPFLTRLMMIGAALRPRLFGSCAAHGVRPSSAQLRFEILEARAQSARRRLAAELDRDLRRLAAAGSP